MPLATYKDLCVDAVDAHRLGAFWAAALGLELERHDDGDARLVGPTPQHAIWVNTVPEPVTVKQRVHLDVNAGAVDDLLALGATVVDLESFPWRVLRDPEGGELCMFEVEEPSSYRLYEVVVDAVDHHAQAAWWAGVLGGTVGSKDGPNGAWSWVEGIPGAPFGYLVFGTVPEPKTVKNRIHWDLESSDIPGLVAQGAGILREPDDVIRWTIMVDPEGNEFCVFAPEPG
ncbi:hypothetical protein DJ010_09865 [Nocardioides silvaticus]|uniref:Glyoxalase-like domain-containing protein n=1 Tax=Nocardioides silvaticus TaxID=2201891 RepID=A0A316TFX7_9ACTN|nr:VOC family protein [Nocardioides silvaticus]PWN03397.1 hypothetical protein DJ010_09865 [Nocardioides silvaticus]